MSLLLLLSRTAASPTKYRSHSTDSVKRKTTTASHTTDASKRVSSLRSHTTDAYKRLSLSKIHTTSGVKRAALTRSHTTGSLLRLRTVYTRTTTATLPTTNADLDTPYQAADYGTVAADDSTYVTQNGSNYLLQEFDYEASSNTQAVTITWNGNVSTAASTATVYLQIWNNTTGLWETLASNSTAAANTDFTLSGIRNTSISSYYAAGNIVTARVYQ